jgi:hypothetical protein
MREKRVLQAIALIVTGLAFILATGCDALDLFDDDEEDGRLTVRLMEAGDSPCTGTDEPLFLVWVYPAGVTDGEQYVAIGAASFRMEDGENYAVAAINKPGPNDDPTLNDSWKGSGGKRYDVYPTVYCVEGGDGDNLDLDNDPPDLVLDPDNPDNNPGVGDDFEGSGFRTYTQDGNQTITTTRDDYTGF